MTLPADDRAHDESVYDGLLVDSEGWAFGTSFDDPLAGLDTTVPDGVDARELAARCLVLGDDALVLAHRLSEWSSRAPDLEDDIALSNIALDLLGQARLLLARAAVADRSLVPPLPDGSPVPDEDALAFFRDAVDLRCHGLVELDNGDFARTVARLLVFAVLRLGVLERLVEHPDPVLSAIAVKGVKEVAYHRDYAARWLVTLALGTDESRRRVVAGLETVWPWAAEVARAYGSGEAEEAVLDQVLVAAELDRPRAAPAAAGHTDALGPLLAEMQSVARAHPMGLW